MLLVLRSPRILTLIEDTLRDEVVRLRPVLDLVLEVVGEHLLLQLAGVGLQGGSGVEGWENVSWTNSGISAKTTLVLWEEDIEKNS
jgi:hypothetical protein